MLIRPVKPTAGLGSFPAWLVVIVSLLMATVQASQEHSPDPTTLPSPRRVVVPKLRGKIKLDGEFNEPVWAKAARLEPFFKNDGSGQEREHTRLQRWFDNEVLYFGST